MNFKDAVKKIRERCMEMGRSDLIPVKIAELKKKLESRKVDEDLAYLTGSQRYGYLKDSYIAQKWASQNRETIASRIIEAMGWTVRDSFETIHNYLGEDGIIRKSAISARKGEKVLIPLNMRDGSIIAIGKGNEDWNYSAPHGAGRLMSRSQASKKISLDEFRDTMQGIYSTSICESTLDEAPFAYKPSEKIVEQIAETVDVVEVIKPLYNFKAS